MSVPVDAARWLTHRYRHHLSNHYNLGHAGPDSRDRGPDVTVPNLLRFVDELNPLWPGPEGP